MSTPISNLLNETDPTDEMANQLMHQMNTPLPPPPENSFINTQPQEYNYPPEAFEDMVEELSYTQKLINFIKLPLLVFFLILLASIPQVNRAITHFIPSFLHESGQMTILGIIFKTVMLTVVFVVVNQFLTI